MEVYSKINEGELLNIKPNIKNKQVCMKKFIRNQKTTTKRDPVILINIVIVKTNH